MATVTKSGCLKISWFSKFRKKVPVVPSLIEHWWHLISRILVFLIFLLGSLSLIPGINVIPWLHEQLVKQEHIVLLVFTVAVPVSFLAAYLIGIRGPIVKSKRNYFMMARRANVGDLTCVTDIADYWYGSEKLQGKEERRKYYEALLSGNARCLWVLLRSETGNPTDWRVVGYTSVLPLKNGEKNDLSRHLAGKLSQYSFNSDSVYSTDEIIKDSECIYVQAICIHPDLISDITVMHLLRHVLNLHIADVLHQYTGDRITLYVEEFDKHEHSFFRSRGFVKDGDSKSLDLRPLHRWDSDSSELPVAGIFMSKAVFAYRKSNVGVGRCMWHF